MIMVFRLSNLIKLVKKTVSPVLEAYLSRTSNPISFVHNDMFTFSWLASYWLMSDETCFWMHLDGNKQHNETKLIECKVLHTLYITSNIVHFSGRSLPLRSLKFYSLATFFKFLVSVGRDPSQKHMVVLGFL